jgi:hypothetical protein
MKPKVRFTLFCCAGLLCIIALYYLGRFSSLGYSAIKIHDTRVAESYDYTKRTTPLPQNVVDDICSKFALNQDDARCQPGAVVYGPDFFKDIKKYFNELPKQETIIPIADEKLGDYLVGCETSNSEGIYGCRYDLRGDNRYTIVIFFTKEGWLYRILAPIGGS